MDSENFIFSETGNIIISNVFNSTINITQYLSRSIDYQELLNDLRELEEDLIEATTVERRKYKEEKITKHKRLIKAFEDDVFQLANTLLSSSNKSLRLKEALAYFEKGLFREAQTLLKVEDLIYDQDALLQKKEYSAKQLKELSESLENNAKEFFVKATLLQMEIGSIRTVKYEPIGFAKFGEIPVNSNIIENVENNEKSKRKQVNLAKEIDDLYQLSFKSCKRPRIIIKYLDFISILSLLEIPYISSYNFSKEKLLSEALDILKTEIKNNPEENGEDYLTVIKKLNDIYYEKEKYNKIIVWCDKALNFIIKYDKFKDHIKSFELTKQSTLYNIAVKKEDINSALNVAREIVKLNPNDFKQDDSVIEFMFKQEHFTMRENIITIYLEKGEFENARLDFFTTIDYGLKELELGPSIIGLIISFYEIAKENKIINENLFNEVFRRCKKQFGNDTDSLVKFVDITIDYFMFGEEDGVFSESDLKFINLLIVYLEFSGCEFNEELYDNYLELHYLKVQDVWGKIDIAEEMESFTVDTENKLIKELDTCFSQLIKTCDEVIVKFPNPKYLEKKAMYMMHWVSLSQQYKKKETVISLHIQLLNLLISIHEKTDGKYLFEERFNEISPERLVKDFPIALIIADFCSMSAIYYASIKEYDIALKFYSFSESYYESLLELLTDDITYINYLCNYAITVYYFDDYGKLKDLIGKIEKMVKNKKGIPSWERFCDAYETLSKW